MDEEIKPKILIVDDNSKNLFAMKTVLKSLSADLFLANSGSEALAMVLQHDFCLILLDVQMPDMDGFEVASLLRGNEKTKLIPIIFVTAISKEEQHIFKGYNLGAVDYLFKPIDPSILKSKVKVFLELNNKEKSLEQLVIELNKAHKELKESTNSLIQSEKMSSLGTFAAGIAHELNNPMMGILNFVQYCLKHTDKDDKRYTVLEDTIEEVKRCADILKNILSFTRSGRGEDDLDDADTEIAIEDLLKRVLQLLAYRIGKSNTKINTHFADNLTKYPLKVNALIQVLLNIISNALDALDSSDKSREKAINIHAFCEDDCLKVIIEDTADGIAPKNLEKIFDFFFTTKPPSKGTGLGLPVSKRIIENQGGKLLCNSQLNDGTTFTITLPVKQAEENKNEEKSLID